MSILGDALNFTGNLAERAAPMFLAARAGQRRADEKKREREKEEAERLADEAHRALVQEGLRLANDLSRKKLTEPPKNNFSYMGKEFETAEQVAEAKSKIDPPRPREVDPIVAAERRERVEDRKRNRTIDTASGHARRWARENYPMVTSGQWSERRLNAEIDRALRKFYPGLSSGDRSDIIASAVSEATGAQLAANRDTRAAESAQGGASALLAGLLEEEGATPPSQARPAGPRRDSRPGEPAPLSAGSTQTLQDRQLRLREQILNDRRLSPQQKQELLDSLRSAVGSPGSRR